MQANVGWVLEGYSLEELIQGITHVDDSCIFSRVFYRKCLYLGLQKVFPEDVGLTEEGGPPATRFLHSIIIIDHWNLLVLPFHPNLEFVLGVSAQQKLRFLVVSMILMLGNISTNEDSFWHM